MKIVFVIYSLGSGGAERVLVNLANFLSKKYEIEILTFTSQDSFYFLNKEVKHKKLNIDFISNNIFQTFINSLKRIYILRKNIQNSNPDIVISFMTHTNLLSIIVSKLLNKKIIVSEDTEYYFYNNKLLFLIRKYLYKFANKLIVKTIADKKNYSFLKQQQISVIANPLPYKLNDLTNISKENFLLAVGRLDKYKGFDTLIEVYSKINTDWKLYIAGEGNEKDNLQKLIKQFKLEKKVFLLGRIEDIFSLFEKASIFVLSSKKEGFGNVLIEAMAYKCAVISYDCPYGPGEIIENEKNGILVENQNKQKLKEAIELLIENKDLREKLANEAIKVREKYSIEKIAKEWENVIKEVL